MWLFVQRVKAQCLFSILLFNSYHSLQGFDNLFDEHPYGKAVTICLQIWSDLDRAHALHSKTNDIYEPFVCLQLGRLMLCLDYMTKDSSTDGFEYTQDDQLYVSQLIGALRHRFLMLELNEPLHTLVQKIIDQMMQMHRSKQENKNDEEQKIVARTGHTKYVLQRDWL